MATLYIIGNGFDRGHELKTSYWNFREYLEKYAEDFLVQLERMYGIGKALWKNFEELLGEANEGEMLDFSKCIVDDLDLDGDPIGIKDTMDVYWEEQYRFIEQLNEYVEKWIRQVRLFKAEQRKTEFIDNTTDYFFTFNYTNVLERIYHIPSEHILHIHGGLPPYCDEPPVLGHGNTERIEQYRERAEEAQRECEEGEESIYNAIAKYYERTRKNTARCMAFKDRFFGQLSGVDQVEIIGQSFGEVDMPYLIYLKSCIMEKAYWKFYFHTREDKDAAEKAVKELGLKRSNYKILASEEFWGD